MNSVTLHKPGSYEIKVPFPATWNELTTAEVVGINKRLLAVLPPHQEPTRQTNILLYLLRSRFKKTKVPRSAYPMIDIQDFATAQADLLQFIFESSTLTRQPFARLLRKIPYIRPAAIGPADEFNDLHVGEYEDADIFANLFAQTKEAKFLQLLAATLYRPSRTWQPGYNAERQLRHFKKIPVPVLMAIYTWFKGCQASLPPLFPHVMDKPGKASNKPPDLTLFTQCIHAAAGPKNGKRSEVRALNLKEFLYEMNLEAKAAKDQIAAMEKAQNKPK